MDYLSELKYDNQILSEVMCENVDQLFEQEILPIHKDFSFDRDLLLRYLQKPGRGIGGSLVLRMAGLHHETEYSNEVISVAAATEILNASLLIIDDWMDRSSYRKGQRTVHKTYEDISNEHHAACQAVQLGMIALYSATAMLSDVRPEIIQNMQRGAMKVTSACMFEARLPHTPKLQNEQNIIEVYKNKTGYYSFLSPIQSGLLLAGVSQQAISSFTDFGVNMGLAFQFQDDIMGIFGNPAETGKPNTDDIREGLYTIIYNTARQLFVPKDFRIIEALHGNPTLDNDQALVYVALLEKYGINEVIANRALTYLEQAEMNLAEIWQDMWNQETRDYLQSIIRFLRQKTYF